MSVSQINFYHNTIEIQVCVCVCVSFMAEFWVKHQPQYFMTIEVKESNWYIQLTDFRTISKHF